MPIAAWLAGEGAVFPRVVALWGFQMNHFGSQIGQKHRRRCRQHMTQVDHPDSF
jgi:hypothetical protein